ncbi:MAG: glycoside hydrolase family 76 protein [Rikenellaceae bacterium]|nr:glycoside hydrolase family 76 protein [Rikenellaceae bacterium]
MKKIILFSLAAAMIWSCAVDDKYIGEENQTVFDSPYEIDWYAAADSATNLILIDKHFMWRGERSTFGWFNPMSDKSSSANNGYWPQAHCIDAVVDAYNRTGDDYYKEIIEQWFEGVPKWQYGKDYSSNTLYSNSYYGKYGVTSGPANNGWWNPFIDDMEWIVLAQIRIHQALAADPMVETEYLRIAREIYDNWIVTTWDVDENGGGLLWSFSTDKSKNACSNSPGAIIAARLYNLTGEEHYLEEAKMIYDWVKWALFVPNTGAVNDNLTNGVLGTYISTYNQGTFLGAAHELYNITGEPAYLEEAIKAADYVINQMTNAKGILPSAHTNDLALFNGIFIRYLTLLANDTKVDKKTRQWLHDFITNQAITVWTQGIIKDDEPGNMLFSGDLEQPAYWVVENGYTCTGVTIVEAMNILKPVE